MHKYTIFFSNAKVVYNWKSPNVKVSTVSTKQKRNLDHNLYYKNKKICTLLKRSPGVY